MSKTYKLGRLSALALSLVTAATVFTAATPAALAEQSTSTLRKRARAATTPPRTTVPAMFQSRARVPGEWAFGQGVQKLPAKFLGIRYATLYGMEPEPEAQFELRRELFFVLSKLIGEPSLRRAAITLPRATTMRALLDSEADDRTRNRATYIEMEQVKGTTPRPITPGLEAALMTTGAALFAGGVVAASFPLAKGVSARPQPWPTGININGSFSLP